MNKYRNISSKDVAKKAGVSQATVSYVLNNVPGIKIKPETREAVLAAAKALNYVPNLNARNMRLKKAMSFAIVSDKNISHFGFMKMMDGIKAAVIPRNYSLTVCFDRSQETEQAEHVQYFIANRIDGIIFALSNPSEAHYAFLTEKNIPFVIIHPNSRVERANLVKNDLNRALREAVQSLKNKNRSQIGFLGNGCGDPEDRRFIGFCQAMKGCGLSLHSSLQFKTPDDEDRIEAELERFLAGQTQLPQALICETPGIGFRLLRLLARRKIRVPEEIAVIAIGSSTFSPLTYPAMSTIESPLYKMGFTAATMLFDIIDNNPAPNAVVLEWAFVPRESS